MIENRRGTKDSLTRVVSSAVSVSIAGTKVLSKDIPNHADGKEGFHRQSVPDAGHPTNEECQTRDVSFLIVPADGLL